MTEQERQEQGLLEGAKLSVFASLVKRYARKWGVTPFDVYEEGDVNIESNPPQIEVGGQIVYNKTSNLFLYKLARFVGGVPETRYYNSWSKRLDYYNENGTIKTDRFFASPEGYIINGKLIDFNSISSVEKAIEQLRKDLEGYVTKEELANVESAFAEAFNDLDTRSKYVVVLDGEVTFENGIQLMPSSDQSGKKILIKTTNNFGTVISTKIAEVVNDGGLYNYKDIIPDKTKIYAVNDKAYIADTDGVTLRPIGTPTTVDKALNAESDNAISNKAVTTALNTKVDKVEGKGLSTNDFTTELKTLVENNTLKDVYYKELDLGIDEDSTEGYRKRACGIYRIMSAGKNSRTIGFMQVFMVGTYGVFQRLFSSTLDPTQESSDGKFHTYTRQIIYAVGAGETPAWSDWVEERIDVDTSLNASSSNPIANSVVASAISGAHSRMDALQGEINDMDDTIQGLASDKADKSTVEALSTRVNTLESSGLKREVVSSLPKKSDYPDGKIPENIIFMLPVRTEQGDYYDEYMWVEAKDSYEKIGSSKTSLDGYTTEEEQNRLVASTVGLDISSPSAQTNFKIKLLENDVVKVVNTKGSNANISVIIHALSTTQITDTEEHTIVYNANYIVSQGNDTGTKLFIVNNAVTNVGIPHLTNEDVETIFNNAEIY